MADFSEEQREAAMRILGNLVRFAHEPNGPTRLCVLMDSTGMVEIMGLEGLFAPHLFVLVDVLEPKEWLTR